MMVRAFAPLLDASISPEELKVIDEVVMARAGIGMHSERTRRAGGKKHIDFHLTLPASMSVKESHDLCDAIETEIETRLHNTSVLIHVEPATSGDKTDNAAADAPSRRTDSN